MAALLQRRARIRDGRLHRLDNGGNRSASPIGSRIEVHRPRSAAQRTCGRIRDESNFNPLPPRRRAESFRATLRLDDVLITRGLLHVIATFAKKRPDTCDAPVASEDPRHETRGIELEQPPDQEIRRRYHYLT